ncbi:MAG: YdcF family protein [Erysipelotrichaceae bacterium]|nr:YdcF family protein [Erysipelotrichaceae bacterium]
MVRFNTRDTKPKIRILAYITAAALAIEAFLISRSDPSINAVSFVVVAWLIAVIVILIVSFIRQLQYNPYSYNTIYYISFAIFAFFTLLAFFYTVHNIHVAGYGGMTAIINVLYGLQNTATGYMVISFPILAIAAILLCISNVQLLRKEGGGFSNYLGIILSIVVVGGNLFLYFNNMYVMGSENEVFIHDMLVSLYSSIYIYFECMIIGTIIASIIAITYKPDYDQDFIIILGCALKSDGTPSPILAGRIERGLQFYRQQMAATGKLALFITSGGQGADEIISESASMRNYLMKQGVPEDHILMEDRSTTTYENLKYSKEIIDRVNPEGKVLIATSGFHVFRAGLMARRVKLKAIGIGSKTKWYFWPNATVREFVGLISQHRLKQAAILGGIILFYIVSTFILYKH